MYEIVVISQDLFWSQYITAGLSRHECCCVAEFDEALKIISASSRNIGAVVINTLRPGNDQYRSSLELAAFVASLQAARKRIDVIIWAPFATDYLSRIVSAFRNVHITASDDPETIESILSQRRAGKKPRARAEVEIVIGAAEFQVIVTINGSPPLSVLKRPWDGRPKLGDLEERFRVWSLWQKAANPPRYTDDWLGIFQEAGKDLAYELSFAAEEVRGALLRALSKVESFDRIIFRFRLLSAGPECAIPFAHVPFELLYDRSKKSFLRMLAPVMRRLELDGDALAAPKCCRSRDIDTIRGATLVVSSDAYGSYSNNSSTFGMSSSLYFPRLEALHWERESIKSLRSEKGLEVRELNLSHGSATDELRNALLNQKKGMQRVSIFHFIGHSIQSDDGAVHLALPGLFNGDVRLVSIEAVAKWLKEAGVKLAVLSSCRSSSSEAVFRLAQFGVPAAIGYRWEVSDTEAAFFSTQLHNQIAEGIPLARAFHYSVRKLGENFSDSPTFASPMLIL